MAEPPAGLPADDLAIRARWPATAGLILATVGFGVSAYLTYEHYTSSTSLSCPATGGIVNCLKVTTSSYSKIGGVPVVVLGLVFFAVMTALQTPQAWLSDSAPVRVARLGWAAAGVGTAAWLVYAELAKLDAICLWCTAVHVVSVLLFAVTVFGTAATTPILDGT